MTTIIPTRKLGESLAAAQLISAWGIPGEERMYEQPELYSWLTADVAVDGSGNYKDRSPRGNNGLSVANQPPIYNNPTTGHAAWTFDGTGGQYITLNFQFPLGSIMVMAVVDLDSTVGTGDGIARAIVGSTMDTTSARYWMGETNRTPMIFNISGSAAHTATISVSVPHLLTFVLDLPTYQIGQGIDGGALVLQTGGTPNFGQRDITGMIGAYRNNFGNPWKGHIYEVLILTASVADAALLTLFQTILKAKHQIP